VIVALCLLAAAAYGLSDYVGGVASRGVSPWAVAFVGQLVGCVAVLLTATRVAGDVAPSTWAWAVLAGVGNGVGTAFLYRGLAAGRMGVVAPVSAVGAALVPVVVGLLTGERPGLLVALGLLAAVPGIWLVASEPAGAGDGPRGPGVLDGVVAGLGFGTLFVALAQVPQEAGLLPLALNLGVGAGVVAALATVLRAAWLPRVRRAWLGSVSGSLGALATGLFMVATRSGDLSVSAVLVSLYPAFTVLLATVLLREAVHRTQAMGLGLCALTVVLVAAG
jgi:uncharacterized membrane protein